MKNHVRMIVAGLACAVIGGSHAQTPPPAAPSVISAPAEASFPASTYACIPVDIPTGDEAAKLAVDEAQKTWLKLAMDGKLERSSPVFLHAPVKPKTDTNAVMRADVCGIVKEGTAVAGMEIRKIPERRGLAGFCSNELNVQKCLASAANSAGYTEEKPWPWLPVYARWPVGNAPPDTPGEIVATLSNQSIEIKNAAAGTGITYGQSTDGPQPLVPCNGNCPPLSQSVTIAPAGAGIGWFIPVAEVPETKPEVPPKPAP